MFMTTPLEPLIGTEFECERDTLLRGVHSVEIRELLQRRGVLVFRRLGLTSEEQLSFTATLGTPQLQGGRDVMPVSLDVKHHKGREYMADYLKGAFYWHIDKSADDVPSLANLLTAVQLSATGGLTQFANTYAAYEALPNAEKEAIAGLKVVHSIENSQRFFRPEPSYEELSAWRRRYPPKTHPLVWTHKSGRKSLVLGATASHVVGMDPFDSFDLLTRLREWTTQAHFVYTHKWEVGDLVMWDNTGTMHRATDYDANSGRLMNRTALEGEEALIG